MILLGDLEGVYPLLDGLPVGFVLVDPDGEVHHLTQGARVLLGRRLRGEELQAMLGDLYVDLVASVLAGRSTGVRWRERQVSPRAGVIVDVAVRSSAVGFPDGRTGALLAVDDVSVEVGLHKRYKELLARQEAINEELRRRIAEVLREHEDDLALFGELLQVAPAIFASFVGEAESAVRAGRALLIGDELDDAAVVLALREAHTLKGNSRGLGLNAIAGRAHALEEIVVQARAQGRPPPRAELTAALADVERAIGRAVALRGSWSGSGAGDAVARITALDGAADQLAGALALLGDHPARAEVAKALGVVDATARVKLSQLADYLRTVARTVATAVGCDPPELEVVGGDVAVPPRVHATLQTALPHLVRNAVVHGLEVGAERVSLGKAAAGRITLTAVLTDELLEVTIADDGRGLDRARLEAAARAHGVIATSLADLVFAPGVSSRDGVDLDAGRGMGAAAARAAILEAGGTVEVSSTSGMGTTFAIRLPVPQRGRR
jgi:signal transduction histidine kinase